jgi:predicted Zn-dependent protease
VSIAYTPKELPENVNISRQSPLREFLKLLVGAVVAVVVLYLLLGFFVHVFVPFIPVSVEKRLGKLVVAGLQKKMPLEKEAHLQSILDTLLPHLHTAPFAITISVARIAQVNALALPGGHIVIFDGLLKAVESDRELAFVIGHEIGHFVNRDHLRGMGRGLSLALIAALLGNESELSGTLVGSLTLSEQRFSQKQEAAADAIGLDLLYNAYGVADGSVSFFERLDRENKVSEFAYFFSSHPSPQKRIERLEVLIRERYGE